MVNFGVLKEAFEQYMPYRTILVQFYLFLSSIAFVSYETSACDHYLCFFSSVSKARQYVFSKDSWIGQNLKGLVKPGRETSATVQTKEEGDLDHN